MTADTTAKPFARRIDLYRFVHKGLRTFLGDTLYRVGRLDAGDSSEVAAAISQVHELLILCRAHLDLEERFLHPALENREPGSSRQTAADHLNHLESFDALGESVRRLGEANGLERADAAHRLYLQLSVFVAENLTHMHVEETVNNGVFWSRYSDEELQALHQRLVSSIPPAEMAMFQRWMVPAMSPPERAGLLSAAKRSRSPEAFATSLDQLRPLLADPDWNKLMAALAGV